VNIWTVELGIIMSMTHSGHVFIVLVEPGYT